jgi:hypothetical protein
VVVKVLGPGVETQDHGHDDGQLVKGLVELYGVDIGVHQGDELFTVFYQFEVE